MSKCLIKIYNEETETEILKWWIMSHKAYKLINQSSSMDFTKTFDSTEKIFSLNYMSII